MTDGTIGFQLQQAGLPTVGATLPGAPQPQQPQAPQPVEMVEGIGLSPYVNMALYGEEGSGKTRFAATAPAPLFLDCENSTTTMLGWPELAGRCKFYRNLRWKTHAQEILKRLSDPNDEWADRETIILDTLDAWQASNLEAILDGSGRNKFLPMEHDYKQSGEMIRRWLNDIREMNRHLIVLTHADEHIGEGGVRFVRPSVTPKLQKILWRDFDLVGCLIQTEDDWSKPFANALISRSNATYKAKSRLRYLPPGIMNPSFDDILVAQRQQQKEGG